MLRYFLFTLLMMLLLPIFNSIILSEESPYTNVENNSTCERSHLLFPMNIGDKWQYKVTVDQDMFDDNDRTYYLSRKVISDTILINNEKYYRISNYMNLLHLDSASGNIYSYKHIGGGNYSSVLMDSLCAGVNDNISTTSCSKKCLEVDSTKLFNDNRLTKSFIYNCNTYSDYYRYAEGIGLFYKRIWDEYNGPIGGYTYYELVYAKINGVEYGDSIVTSTDQENENIPTHFELKQNYPNPFNPVTTINYQIPNYKTQTNSKSLNHSITQTKSNAFNVQLKVYDILGREVATLVNEHQPPGTYRVKFNGNELVSGIYFYELRAENLVITKKMMLIK